MREMVRKIVMKIVDLMKWTKMMKIMMMILIIKKEKNLRLLMIMLESIKSLIDYSTLNLP